MNPSNPIEAKAMYRGFGFLSFCASVAFLCAAIWFLCNLSHGAVNPNNVPTIAVSGTGQATAIPDTAEFSFTVDKTAATVVAAQNAASALANQAIAAVEQAGVASKDVQTTDYSINPHYTYTATQPTVCPLNSIGGCSLTHQVPDGYEVSQTVDVKVEMASTTGQILQTIGGLGITEVSGITFTESNKDAAEDQARAAAIADAQAKAKTLASQLGVSLGPVVTFQESNNYPQPVMYAAAGVPSAALAPAPEIPAGQNTVTDNVTVTYEIH